MKRSVVILIVLLISLSVLLQRTATAEPAAPMELPDWSAGPDPPGQLISTNSPNGAGNPVIRYATDGSRVMIVYVKQLSGSVTDTDIFYAVSTNDGEDWSAPQAVYSSLDESLGETLAFAGNTAHAAWIERSLTTGDKLVTASKTATGSWSASPTEIANGSFLSMSSPDMIANGTDLHVVWFEGIGTANIQHAWYNAADSKWETPAPVMTSVKDSREPAIAVDSSGKLHVVWEEYSLSNPSDSNIYYAQGTVSGSTVTWAGKIAISSGDEQHKFPNVAVSGHHVRVSYTRKLLDSQQSIYYTECSSSCTSASSWSNPTGVSGQFVGANEVTTKNIFSDMVYDSDTRTTYIYFHGYDPNGNTNEIMWGVNSCDDWSASARDRVTENTTRVVLPSIATSNGYIQMAMQQISGTDNQIYHMYGTITCTSYLYLPVILRD